MTDVVLTIDGVKYSGWREIDATISMETLSGVFNVSLTDNIGDQSLPVKRAPLAIPFQSVSVSLNGTTVITGYIDKVSPSIDANSHTITIQGRDKTADLCDCSMIDPISQWKGLTIDSIIKKITAPFGIPVTLHGDAGESFDNFVVEQGASCFEVIQKLCYMRQLLAISDGKGGLLLTKAGSETVSMQLQEGVNIKSGQAVYDGTQRFSTYLCKGQKQGDDFSSPQTTTQPVGKYDDSAVPRYRPLLIIAEGQATFEDCSQRAKWEGSIRRGKAKRLNITVNGWTMSDGNLWSINKLVTIRSQLLGVDDSLLISQVDFKLDENGEIAVLTLTSPEAYTLNTTSIKKQKTNPYLGD